MGPICMRWYWGARSRACGPPQRLRAPGACCDMGLGQILSVPAGIQGKIAFPHRERPQTSIFPPAGFLPTSPLEGKYALPNRNRAQTLPFCPQGTIFGPDPYYPLATAPFNYSIRGRKPKIVPPKRPKRERTPTHAFPKSAKKRAWCAKNGKALPKCVPKKGKQRARVFDRSFPFRAFIEGPF